MFFFFVCCFFFFIENISLKEVVNFLLPTVTSVTDYKNKHSHLQVVNDDQVSYKSKELETSVNYFKLFFSAIKYTFSESIVFHF